MSSLAIYGPHSSSAQPTTRYRAKTETWPVSSDISAKVALALTATLAPYVVSGGYQTVSSSLAERISVASNVELAVSRKAARKVTRRPYSRTLTLDEHRVFQAAILDNAEVVHRGRYVEL
jgi:hypothetical protein